MRKDSPIGPPPVTMGMGCDPVHLMPGNPADEPNKQSHLEQLAEARGHLQQSHQIVDQMEHNLSGPTPAGPETAANKAEVASSVYATTDEIRVMSRHLVERLQAILGDLGGNF